MGASTVKVRRMRPVAALAAASVIGAVASAALITPGNAHVGGGVTHVFAHIKSRIAYEVVREDFEVPAGGFLRDTANCPDGKEIIGGGAQVVGEGTADFDTVIQESTPGTVGGGATHLWLVSLQNTDNVAHTIGIFAVCADLR